MPAQDAILTKDNILRRKWQGDPGCYFCGGPEDRDHFFSCPVAKVVWGVFALCFHQSTRPSSYVQYWTWIQSALPGGAGVCAGIGSHMLGNLESKKYNLF
jgi:hypothetical protein